MIIIFHQIKTSFPLGRVVLTDGVKNNIPPATLHTLLQRHAGKDWGDICENDRKLNDYALENGDWLTSAYKISSGDKIWIITEADRSATTVMLPSEY